MEPDGVSEHEGLPLGATRCECWPTPAGAGSAVGELALDRAAVPASVRILRRALRDWASSAELDLDTVDAIVLAVDEAVTNAVEHGRRPASDGPEAAGPGVPADTAGIRLHAASTPCGDGVAVSITDRGTWRPAPADPGHRGRGIQLMGRLADRSTITTEAAGTTVRMCWTRA